MPTETEPGMVAGQGYQAEQHDEVERKYDVDDRRAVPDLSQLAGVTSVAAPDDVEQVTTYFDTPQLALLARGVTLRRRTGGTDDGWHLKLPGTGDRRTEIRLPLVGDQADVPDLLSARVQGLVRDRALSAVAVLTTRRRIHQALDAEGQVLVELCDDRVRAETDATDRPAVEWREWEVELAGGPLDLLDSIEPLLLGAGAQPAAVPSKAARVLGDRLSAGPGRRTPRDLGDEPTTAELLVSYCAEHLRRLEEQDLLLRAGDQEALEEAVHQLRVAARRLRSALATYAPALEPGSTDWLRAELQWLGAVLGEARDAQVLRTRLDTELSGQSGRRGFAAAKHLVDKELTTRFRAGRRDADEALESTRYFRLLDALDDFAAAPAAGPEAGKPASEQVAKLLQTNLRRVRRRHRAFTSATDSGQRDVALHDVRKAAKRLRYAAESARPVFGGRAVELAEGAEALQELLGEHQDTVVARRVLREIAAASPDRDGVGAVLGRLHADQERRAGELEREYPEVFDRLPRRFRADG